MSEIKQKRSTKRYNEDIIKALIEKYGVSGMFVRASLRGDRTSLTSDSIVKDYKRMNAAAKQAVEQFKQVNN